MARKGDDVAARGDGTYRAGTSNHQIRGTRRAVQGCPLVGTVCRVDVPGLPSCTKRWLRPWSSEAPIPLLTGSRCVTGCAAVPGG